MAKILLVEDDADNAKTVQDWLITGQHVVDLASTGNHAKSCLENCTYDVIILDWNLPDLPGIDVLKKFRDSGGMTPVLILTGNDTIEHKEKGYGSGADDYLTKPFSLRELSLKVEALLRRPPILPDRVLTAGSLVLDPDQHTCYAATIHSAWQLFEIK